MLSVTHIMPVLVLLSVVAVGMQQCMIWNQNENVQTQQSQDYFLKQEVKVIWQKAPHGGPIPRLGVTPGGWKLYH